MQISYDNINSLEEIYMIAGSYYELVFKIYNENGSPVLLLNSPISWYLAPYGRPDESVIKLTSDDTTEIDITGDNEFTVYLRYDDTINLATGKYIQQPVVGDFEQPTSYFRPAQGVVTIIPSLQKTS